MGNKYHIIFAVTNLLILIGVLVYSCRQRIGEFFFSRKKNIKERKEAAENSFSKAAEDRREYNYKLENFCLEEKAVLDMAEREGAEEGQDIISRAEKMAERMLAQARSRGENEKKRYARRLYEKAVDICIGEAGEKIAGRIRSEDQIKTARRFLEMLKNEPAVKGEGAC